MNKNIIRGYTYEFLVAQSIIDNSPMSKGLSLEDNQWDLIDNRRNYARELEEKYYDEFLELKEKSQHVAELLPHSIDYVSFTPQAANDNEVYDIYYDSNQGRIKVSCKTQEVEDKNYSFNTNNYIPENIDIFNKETLIVGKTFKESLEESGYSIKEYQQKLVELMISSDNKELLVKLTNDRFIGSGDYYKTLNDGGVRYYPPNNDNDHIEISNIVITNYNSFQYTALLKDNDDNCKQEYSIDFKIVFKNSYNSKVKKSKNGSIDGIRSSIKLTLKNPLEKHN